jgi:hypothetical protein
MLTDAPLIFLQALNQVQNGDLSKTLIFVVPALKRPSVKIGVLSSGADPSQGPEIV